jgi:hypothetical protein
MVDLLSSVEPAGSQPVSIPPDLYLQQNLQAAATGGTIVGWDSHPSHLPTPAPALLEHFDVGAPLPALVEPDDRPCVEWFLPMLRVLGKGSFGKVRLREHACVTANTPFLLIFSHNSRSCSCRNELVTIEINCLP